jgi:hypothetical protein
MRPGRVIWAGENFNYYYYYYNYNCRNTELVH